MATLADFQDVLTQIDTATTAIGVKIEKLTNQLATAGLTDAQEADILAQLHAEAQKLVSIAADPADPVPEPPPDTIPV